MSDLRAAFRQLLRNPGFVSIAVLTLGLGIGANSLIFSAINAVLIKWPPYRDPDRLVWLFVRNPTLGYQRLPPNWASETVAELLDQTDSFEQTAKIRQKEFLLRSDGRSEQVRGMRVSGNFFSLLGVSPILGRSFIREENQWGKHHVVVISHECWLRRFGGDPLVLGRAIELIDTEVSDRDGQPHASLDPQRYIVIGILPPLWRFPVGAPVSGDVIRTTPGAEFWEPESLNPAERQRRSVLDNVLARVKPGLTLAQATIESRSLFQRLRAPLEASAPGYSLELLPLRDQVEGSSRLALLVLAGATGFVLLIAGANVANLLLERATARRKEFAIRAALGAGRARLSRQLIVESTLLALGGGFLGLALAWWGTRVLARLRPVHLPRVDEIQLDWHVLAFTFALALLTGLAFGVGPALSTSQWDVQSVLREVGQGSTAGFRRLRLRRCLVMVEVALSLMLLVTAGLLMRSFARLISVDPGFQTQGLLSRHLSFHHPRYREQDVAERLGELLERVRAIPGVQSAAVSSWLPIEGGPSRFAMAFPINDRPQSQSSGITVANMSYVTPEYFRTMGIPLLKGRDFAPQDLAPGTPSVKIVTASFVRRFLNSEEPLGRRVAGGEIVGVVGDTREAGLDLEAEPHLYHAGIHTGPLGLRGATLAVRGLGDVTQLPILVENTVLEWDKQQPAAGVWLIKEIVSESLAERRFQMLLLGTFASVALILAVVGVFSVITYTTSQRIKEIGIRMALGARAADVRRIILQEGMSVVVVGLGIGVAGALVSTRILSSLLFDLKPTDPITFTGAVSVLTGAALLACYLPARRASKVDPAVALRNE